MKNLTNLTPMLKKIIYLILSCFSSENKTKSKLLEETTLSKNQGFFKINKIINCKKSSVKKKSKLELINIEDNILEDEEQNCSVKLDYLIPKIEINFEEEHLYENIDSLYQNIENSEKKAFKKQEILIKRIPRPFFEVFRNLVIKQKIIQKKI